MQAKMVSDVDTKKIWYNVLESIKVDVSPAIFTTWFSQTHISDFQKDSDRYLVEVGCNSSFVKATIESRYFGLVQDLLKKELESACDIVFTVKTLQEKSETENLPPLFAQKQTSENPSDGALERTFTDAALRPTYQFTNFAVSSSNQMAHAAAEAVAQDPGHAYNPLFIWGGVGVGKTHLMNAIGLNVLRDNPDTTAYLCSAEQFTNDIVDGIRNKTTAKVRAKYRKLKILMIDDIQFIAGKDTVQEEFFHTFNSLVSVGAQIVMTSDQPPDKIAKLEERLRSRFEAGLIVDIAPLDFELRSAICIIKSKERGIALTHDHISLIAGNITSARQIEGFLVKLVAQSKLKNIPITEELIKSLLGKDGEISKNVKASPDEVIKAACKYFTVLKKDLVGDRRSRPIARPRQIVMYFLRTELNLPFQEIGRIIGGRDHTTVMHAVDKITELASSSVDIREDIMGIKNSL